MLSLIGLAYRDMLGSSYVTSTVHLDAGSCHPCFVNDLRWSAITPQQLGWPSARNYPVVINHPDGGRKSLFVNRGYTSHIVGMTKAESASQREVMRFACAGEVGDKEATGRPTCRRPQLLRDSRAT
jgi:hypothetical protein